MAAVPKPSASRDNRDNFTATVRRTVSQRVGSLCSNPGCGTPTCGPTKDPSDAANIGVAAHMSAASPGGPRFDDALSAEARSSILNAIWLCQNCAKRIDDDEEGYPIQLLQGWKARAELEASQSLGRTTASVKAIDVDPPLDPEEQDLLRAAAEKGSFWKLDADQAPGGWIRAGDHDFVERQGFAGDPAYAAAYLEAFESLRGRGYMAYRGGDYYSLTGSGFRRARELRSGANGGSTA